ncbi:BatD family protein [Pedobacter sp. MC2016-14]|uniref:BatD family protein n=1 Tax=Pedobacter sp. MC2016-14 TaxID=2897327 RepID=UPI001E347444|nr:BatD family protein [Pedobacter sp. MC2016-14]MCD0489277.1 BatD family protein [Pedobacter sp. MC2016-14]
MKKTPYILVLLMLWSVTLLAQNIKFTASLSQNTVGTGEAFELSFSVNGNIESFNPPDLSIFRVLGGPNQSSSMTSINGNTTMSMSLGYDLMAVKEGEYTIGAATITANGKTYRSNPLKIKVVKGRAVQQQQNGSSSNSAQQQDVAPGNPANLAKSLFIRAIPDKTSVYQGEQISVTYKLYTNVSLVDMQPDKLPEFNGFWSQEIKNNNPNIEWATEVYKGVSYHTGIIKQIILFPEHAGNLALDPLGATFSVRQAVPSNDPFEQLFGGGSFKDSKYKVKSAQVTIRVKPLPMAGKPAGFQGAVGDFSLGTVVDKDVLKANESLNYTIKISGSGNLKLLPNLTVDFPEGFEKYDPKITDKITESVNGVSGSRDYTFLTIPRKEGKYTIPAYKFSYFNPATGQYHTLISGTFPVTVNKGDVSAESKVFTSGNKKDGNMLDGDEIDIQSTQNHFSTAMKALFGTVWLYIILVVAVSSWFGYRYYRNWNLARNIDPEAIKKRNANKLAAKYLAQAKTELQKADRIAFYEAIYKGIYGYLSHKLSIAVSDLNHHNIVSRLRDTKLNENTINELLKTLEMCEMARYAPVSSSSEPEVFEKAKNNIADIEAHFKGQ